MTRTEYKNQRGQRIRRHLIQLLGGKCASCGSKKRLEIDHPFGREWDPRKTSQEQRASNYMQEYLLGLAAGVQFIRVLCKRCNVVDGNKRRHEAPVVAVQPMVAARVALEGRYPSFAY